MRHRDVHILTAGEQTFTSDQRFAAKHNSEDEWVLLIKYVQVSCEFTGHYPETKYIGYLDLFLYRKEMLVYMSVRFQLSPLRATP